MSKMGLLGAIGFSLALVTLTQIPSRAEGCKILSATASGPSSILVKWERVSGATNYLLDLRVKGNNQIAPVVVSVNAATTQKDIQGLRPGKNYTVTLKVFQFLTNVLCEDTIAASTVPDSSQIVVGYAVSSTSIYVEWTSVPSAEHYYLTVQENSMTENLNFSSTKTSGLVENLKPSTHYNCYVYTANSAGLGRRSKVRTILTLVQPPVAIKVEQTGQFTAKVSWQPVEDVLMYKFSIQNIANSISQRTVQNVTNVYLDVNDIFPCSTYLISVSSYNLFLIPSEPNNYTYSTNTLATVSSVTANYKCSLNTATVSWMSVFGATSYSVKAIGDDGDELTCTSEGSSCQISGMGCGQSYVVHVTPMSLNCRDTESTTTTFHTVACPPQDLQLHRDCASHVITFSWSERENSHHYIATAVDSKGAVQTCMTEENMCVFANTNCGLLYSFTVISAYSTPQSAETCHSLTSAAVEIETAPCIPRNLQTSSECSSDILLSTWDLAEGALRYTVNAYGNKGEDATYSCSSVSNSCAMTGVSCGEYLSIYITASNDECSSPPALGSSPDTVPCIPTNVAAVRDCGAGSLTVTWSISHGAIFYVAIAEDSEGTIHRCNSMDISCTIENLKCNTDYEVYVYASTSLCDSSDSERVASKTGACPPTDVTATLDCMANEALVSWQDDSDMSSFTATMEDDEQALLSCNSVTTSCRIENLECGKNYAVTVQHHDSMCPGMPSEVFNLDSVPCGPANMEADVDCASGGITVSWDPSPNVVGYTAVVSDGTAETSHEITEPMLTIAAQDCGQQYTVSVVSKSLSCVSFPSVFSVSEAPCAPTNVVAERNCGKSFMEVTWDASQGAKNYIVTAVGNDGSHLECVSNETSCDVEGVSCSQVYSISVAATDDTCSGPESPQVQQITAPCPPTELTVSMDCSSSNSAVLTWGSSQNAVSYTGKAESPDGHIVLCETATEVTCQIDGLHCGKEYNFTVSASDGFCQTPDSDPVILSTAPCTVQDVLSHVDCSSNSLIVSWSPGSMPLTYSVTAQDGDSNTLSCTTEESTCAVTGLECGEQYTVTVQAASGRCEGESSVAQTVDSVPCVPENVQAAVVCSTNTLHATWDAPCPTCDVSFNATLTGEGGFTASCATHSTECDFHDLQCAETYTLSVVAVSDTCNSFYSDAVTKPTAPCDPSNVDTNIDCSTGAATVTWEAGAGAELYTVVAEANGHFDSCISLSTSCDLTKLQCGEEYTIIVLAGDGTCNSSLLATTHVTTAPCAPVISSHEVDCVSNTALVIWDEDANAESVTVTATSQDNGDTVSCSSSDTSCILQGLLCGHTYNVQAAAQGANCLSDSSTTTTIVTAPCTPTNVQYTYSCDNEAIVTWDDTLGTEEFHVVLQSAEHETSCVSPDLTCTVSSLRCGSTYDVTVTAKATHCDSNVPGVAQIVTAPCPPEDVNTTLLCDSNTGVVSWKENVDVLSYVVTAVAGDGDTKECSSTDTSCNLSELKCGQNYAVTVTPSSSQCRGEPSPEFTLQAAACPPTNVQASLQCEGNLGLVSWNPVQGAEEYVVIAMDNHEHTCTSTGLGCSLTDLECGVTTVIKVVTVLGGCRGNPSLPFVLQTAICPPSSVVGETNCGNNDITVSWEPILVTGVTYLLTYERVGGTSINHFTDQASFELTNLQCGQQYSFQVAAKDSECNSALSELIEVETAPCSPTNLQATAECGTNLGIMTWELSPNAVSYTVSLTGNHGHQVQCTSNTTTCSAKLDCGRQYTAVIVATSATCDSIPAAPLTFDSAPCLPENVNAALDCSDNSIAVQWSGSSNDVSIYTAIAIGSDDTRQTCDTTTTSCTIQNLKCGLTYSIVVTTPAVNCGTIDGSDYTLQTAPCTPTNVMVDPQCSGNMAVVSWKDTGPNQVQEVNAVDSQGDITTCSSGGLSCTLNDLICGETYAISVDSRTDSCSSEPTATITLNIAPCVPTNLQSNVDCWTDVTTVTWDAALGATSYTVYAEGSLGHSTDKNVPVTTWDFADLQCGQDYNITVVAHRGSCNSLVSESISVTTGPCPHTELQVNLDCDSNTAVMSWTPGRGVLSYTARAIDSDSAHNQSCSTDASSCNITSLLCGHSYMVSVTGEGHTCMRQANWWQEVLTAPCAPTDAIATATCDSTSISVLWQASAGSVSYMAVAEGDNGQKWSCNTTNTDCLITGPQCGQQYQVYVVGVNNGCFGPTSNTVTVYTAPCEPLNVQLSLDCQSDVLNVTWESTGHFELFHATLSSSEGTSSLCTSEEHYCLMSDLQCDLQYTVTVVAEYNSCNSAPSPPENVHAAPCPQSTFLPQLNCSTGVLSVMWYHSMDGVLYTVTAVDKMGNAHNCDGTARGCDLDTLDCGTEYDITITPSRGECLGKDSATQTIRTAPCAPSISSVEIDCLTNSAWVIYEEAAGADDYVVMMTDSWNTLQSFDCNATSERTCSVPPLPCSKAFTFTMIARDQQCSSPASDPFTTETAPCAPLNVRNVVGCTSSSISISWSPVPGAVSYTATLEEMDQVDGVTTCCTTSDTTCEISDLPCGEFYFIHVTVEGHVCNSSQSEGIVTKTTPCIPQDLQASLSCSTNVATMTWESTMSGQRYRVTAVAADGHEHVCLAFQNTCELTDLHCGELYTATVRVEDPNCNSLPSENVTIKTVPCTPESISAEVDCDSNTLVVSYSESEGADLYTAIVQDSDGQTTSCHSTEVGSCSLSNIACGQIYRAVVVSSDGYCESPPTPVSQALPVPCSPRNIMAHFDCYTQTAIVAWFPSDGAISYQVTATPTSGDDVTVDTASTDCELEGLQCGESYTVTVTALGEDCRRSATMIGKLKTGPCVPQNINAEYSWGVGQVTWDHVAGAESYTVKGVTVEGREVSCTNEDNYCALPGLQCGQLYNISVIANNNVCESLSTSVSDVIITEPCPPNNVEGKVNCENNMGTVTWEQSFGAIGYMVLLNGRDGHYLTCHSENTYCNVEGLHCGIVYYVVVVAVGETLNSTASTQLNLDTAPCEAANVEFDLNCNDDSVTVTWSEAEGAVSYKVTAMSDGGLLAMCETEELSCQLTDLECGQTYTITLTVISDLCPIEMFGGSFTTRHCQPENVEVDLQCGADIADMHWEEMDGVELYIATATCIHETLECNTTTSTCQFSNLHCGEIYEFSVTAFNNGCFGETSTTLEINTEPCTPTDLIATGSCHSDTVMLNWSPAEGALVYEVMAIGNLGYVISYQTNETLLEAELPCGQLYTFTVTAQDDRCDSSVSLSAEFKTGPCIPGNVESFTHCENNLGLVSWSASDGAEAYKAIAVGEDGHSHECLTDITTCSWDDLHCGDVYTVHVVARDGVCLSEPSQTTTIRMAPCIPQDVVSSLNCTTKVGSLSWSASETAESYIVTAETTSGHVVQVSTNDTWTFISEFLCGQEYFLSVAAMDSECTSLPSQPATLNSVPCAPTGVTSFLNCVSNIALVSWMSSAGADFYTATVHLEDGISKSCFSEGQECGIANLNCGRTHTLTVVASDHQCTSDASEARSLQSVPCIPTNVDISMDCTKNEALVSWSASDGALSYNVMAQTTNGLVSYCETTDLQCSLSNLNCGLQYFVQVVALDNICSSLPSPASPFLSVPCTPLGGLLVLDCFTNSALFEWSFIESAVEYKATARSSDGHASTCTSNITNCELKNLQCGQIYNVIVVSSNGQCDSQPSSTLQVESVPCPPTNVEASLLCFTNTANVQWQSSLGADSYMVQALCMDGHETGCESSSGTCSFSDLMCGCTYSISVISTNEMCNVSKSDTIQLQSVPCVAQNVDANLDCESGSVTVSWEPSLGAIVYDVFAQGNAGYASTCNSTETTCTFQDLLCGLTYSITVSASDDTCISGSSSAVEISSLPCVAQQVEAVMVCSNDTGVVSWEEAEQVFLYSVQAFGSDGHMTLCQSDQDSCQLHPLHCGQLYDLTVSARNGECDNSHAYLQLQSVPCTPTSVKTSLQCMSNTVSVTWEQASGAVSYLTVGVTADGSHQVECNNTETYCDLSDLQCGQTYGVTVLAQDDSCSSVESTVSHVQTAPCAPQGVTVNEMCAEATTTISWDANPDVDYFHVLAISNSGARLYCNSTGTSCTLSSLPCGQQYEITVLAIRDDCESQPSTMVSSYSAPCPPVNANGNLDCVTNAAFVAWTTGEGALSYQGIAQAANGHTSGCNTTGSSCEIPDLKCGTRYNFSVTAFHDHCQSNSKSTFQLVTGPCALSEIHAEAHCTIDTILVRWENTEDSTVFVVSAEDTNHDFTYCNSTADTCILPNMFCGMEYSVIVSASSNRCSNLRSPPKKIKTVPCVPSDVSVKQVCEGEGVVVTWAPSLVATLYELTAIDGQGNVFNCTNTESTCTFTDLHCGQDYGLTITATGDNCTSMPSLSTFTTAPCPPTGLMVYYNCESTSAILSWNPSEGAVNYHAVAQPTNGDPLYCESSTPTCTFEDLECGETYTFSAESSNGICNSSSSESLEEGAVPCPPTEVKVKMQKSEGDYWAMSSWNDVNCTDVEFQAQLTGRIGNSHETLMEVSGYWLTRKYFEFPIPCSTAFMLTVRARNSAGEGPPSSTIEGTSEPCPPQNVQYSGNASSAVVFWEASILATQYTVYGLEGEERTKLCETTELSCWLPSFNPSAAEVTASNDVGESDPNSMIIGPVDMRRKRDLRNNIFLNNFRRGLKVPQDVTVSVSQVSMHTKWKKVNGATEYVVVFEEQHKARHHNQLLIVKTVVGTSHTETDLKPDTTYCFRVAAKNALEQSDYTPPECQTTGDPY